MGHPRARSRAGLSLMPRRRRARALPSERAPSLGQPRLDPRGRGRAGAGLQHAYSAGRRPGEAPVGGWPERRRQPRTAGHPQPPRRVLDAAIDGVWADLVDDARWAPSPHNLQSWLVRVRGASEAELLYDPARVLPQTDPLGRFITVGLGVFIESLAVAASARGLALTVAYDGARIGAGARRPAPFARLALAPADVDEPLSVRLLHERRTSRLPYDGRDVRSAAGCASAPRRRRTVATASRRPRSASPGRCFGSSSARIVWPSCRASATPSAASTVARCAERRRSRGCRDPSSSRTTGSRRAGCCSGSG